VACDERAAADLAVWARVGLRDARGWFRLRVIIALRVADSRTVAAAVVASMWVVTIAGTIAVGRGSATAWAEQERGATAGSLYAEALYMDFPERVPKTQWPRFDGRFEIRPDGLEWSARRTLTRCALPAADIECVYLIGTNWARTAAVFTMRTGEQWRFYVVDRPRLVSALADLNVARCG
jgi:hypothetical protein